MSVNKYKPHVYLIPEDDANRQLAVGFLNHAAVADAVVGVRGPAGGWAKVLDVFESEYLPLLGKYPHANVVMLIDFDGADDRRVQCENRIPVEVRSRVFVVGSKFEPETLKRELKMAFGNIGGTLAQDCLDGSFALWRHPHLIHNQPELQRLVDVIKPILF